MSISPYPILQIHHSPTQDKTAHINPIRRNVKRFVVIFEKDHNSSVCVCVCVCERERDRQTDRDRNRGERDMEAKTQREREKLNDTGKMVKPYNWGI